MAAPVSLSQETIGFLMTGQVMREKATPAQFKKVADEIGRNGGRLDREKLRSAYMATPVVPNGTMDSVALLLSIFAEHLAMQRNQLALPASNTEPAVVTKARASIDINLHYEVSLADTAKAAGASTFHLCKLFRRHLDMTFTEYIARRRVEKAKKMLLKPNMRVSEVAFKVGFQSLTHFNRVFRKIVGRSPTEFRSHFSDA
jgi:AraC-like DNA-binding protein